MTRAHFKSHETPMKNFLFWEVIFEILFNVFLPYFYPKKMFYMSYHQFVYYRKVRWKAINLISLNK